MVNTTTVAITTSFLTIVSLGLASVFHDAALKVQASATEAAKKPDGEFNEGIISEYGAEYQEQYQKYLRDYAAWAELHGQDPVPPQEKSTSLTYRSKR